jgi:hypothetical protein
VIGATRQVIDFFAIPLVLFDPKRSHDCLALINTIKIDEKVKYAENLKAILDNRINRQFLPLSSATSYGKEAFCYVSERLYGTIILHTYTTYT